MLKIGIHHGDIGGGRTERALDAGARQSASSDSADAAHPGIVLGELLGDLPGPVGTVVVDEDDFPRDVAHRLVEQAYEARQVLRFVEGRNDDRHGRGK